MTLTHPFTAFVETNIMLTLVPNMDLFKGLTPQQVETLQAHFHTCVGHTDDVIFQAGEPAEMLYLVLQGNVSIIYTPYDGEPMTLAQVGPGRVCGWSAIVGRESYTSDGVCTTETRLMCIRREALKEFCRREPQIGRQLLTNIAEQVAQRWSDARAEIDRIFAEWLGDETEASPSARREPPPPTRPTLEEQVRALLEQLSAYIEQYHGGGVEFIALDGRTLKVRLRGACIGCPLSPTTLHGWVAGTLHQFFPEIEVEAV